MSETVEQRQLIEDIRDLIRAAWALCDNTANENPPEVDQSDWDALSRALYNLEQLPDVPDVFAGPATRVEHALSLALTRSDPAVRDRVTDEKLDERLPCMVMGGRTHSWKQLDSGTTVCMRCGNHRPWLVDRFNALRTSPPKPALGWLSMDSAPKDGRPVLLAYWRGAGAKGVTTGSYGVNGHDQWTTAGNCSLNSFAWQPLPPPPAKEPQ